nr:hypothetical protein CFP56_22945 [Quercus suber]
MTIGVLWSSRERRRDSDRGKDGGRKFPEGSRSRMGIHVSHEQETRNIKSEIDYLCKKLRRRALDGEDRTPPLSSGSEDGNCRPRSRTPLSESFSTSSCLNKAERHNKRHRESSFPKSMGNDAMSKALRQIAKSPFTRRIDRANLPHRFT